MHRYVRIGEERGAELCCVVLDVPDAEKARRGSVRPYSATVAPIPTKPATPIHRSRPRDGSTAISRPGMHHRSVISTLNPTSSLKTT